MSKPRTCLRPAVAAAALIGLAAFAIVTAPPIAAQGGKVVGPPPHAKCYPPSKQKATVQWMGDHPDRPLHKGCPPSLGKVIGKYCYVCESGHLDVGSKWCYTCSKPGTHWSPLSQQCCG